jgi:hypothetical protein
MSEVFGRFRFFGGTPSPETLAAMEQQLRRMLTVVEPLTVERWLVEMRQDASTEGAWAVECSRACCHRAARDGVGVAIPTAEVDRERGLDGGGDPAMRSVLVAVIDGHRGRDHEVLIDVEDAKQLVNRLAEAIATIEGRGRRCS